MAADRYAMHQDIQRTDGVDYSTVSVLHQGCQTYGLRSQTGPLEISIQPS